MFNIPAPKSTNTCFTISTPIKVIDYLIEKDELKPELIDHYLKIFLGERYMLIRNSNCVVYTEDFEHYFPASISKLSEDDIQTLSQSLDRIREQIANKIRTQFDVPVYDVKQFGFPKMPSKKNPIKWKRLKNKPTTGIKTRQNVSSKWIRQAVPFKQEMCDSENIMFEQRFISNRGLIAVIREYKEEIMSGIELKNLSIEEIIKVIIDALNGSICIRDSGFTHCDIKPTNIFVEFSEEKQEYIGKVGDLEGLIISGSEYNDESALTTTGYTVSKKKQPTYFDQEYDVYSWSRTIRDMLTKFNGKKADQLIDLSATNPELMNLLTDLDKALKKGVSSNGNKRPKLEVFRDILAKILDVITKVETT